MVQDLFHADALMTSHILSKSSKKARGIQKPYIEEGQTIQWPKGKRQSDKQRVGNRCVEGREVKCLNDIA
jgi:hypothetical protein